MNPFEDDTKSDGEGDVTQHLVSPHHLPFDLELCLRILIELGFNEQVAKRVLEETSDLNSSLIKLHEKIKIARIDGLNDEVAKLWRSPFSARVASWVMEKDAMSEHTVYIVKVTIHMANYEYQVVKRYSAFHKLYLDLYPHLLMAFPSGMQNLFPDNRLSTWFAGGETDSLRNSRKEYLDGWLREVCMNPLVMLNAKARTKIYAALELGGYFPTVASSMPANAPKFHKR